MIYCVITNRPEFLDFAVAQSKKCKGVELVILANGPAFENVENSKGFYYKPEWRYSADAFNWFRENYPVDDDLFLMDDDIFLNHDVCEESLTWLKKGFDRVVYTSVFLRSLAENKTVRTTWKSRQVGGAWAMAGHLWRAEKWPDWPKGAMLRYFNDLPEHNIKMITKPRITHLIHDKNIVLNSSHFKGEHVENDPQLTKELSLINQ